MKKGQKCEYVKNYSEEIEIMLENTILTEEQSNKLNEIKEHYKGKKIGSAIEDIYKMYINGLSTTDIGNIYNKDCRSIQMYLKNVGLNRDRFEAQAIAVTKRNYTEIRKTYKRTMADRLVTNQLTGSLLENYIRHEINMMLGEQLTGYEIIVGINSMYCIEGESDIPIVIIKGDCVIFKAIIEVDGVVFHEERKVIDCGKDIKILCSGYMVYRISTKAYYNSEDNPKIRYEKEVKSKLMEIISEIVDYVHTEK